MAKRSAKETYEIVKHTYELISKGKGYNEIRCILHDTYNISYAHADKYHTKALIVIRKEFAKDMVDIKNTSLLSYDKMIDDLDKEDMSPKDKYRIKLDIKKQMDKIKGIEITKIDGNFNINNNTELKIIGVDSGNTDTKENTGSDTENKA